MDASDYQKAAARTLVEHPDFPNDDSQKLLLWGIIGLTGEAGEVAEIIKKGVLHGHGVDYPALIKELGDVLWYVSSLCSAAKLDISDVMLMNIDKLKKRYPNGFSAEDSRKRIDVEKP